MIILSNKNDYKKKRLAASPSRLYPELNISTRFAFATETSNQRTCS